MTAITARKATLVSTVPQPQPPANCGLARRSPDGGRRAGQDVGDPEAEDRVELTMKERTATDAIIAAQTSSAES